MLKYIIFSLLFCFAKSNKNCINCKHYINANRDPKNSRFGQCRLFPLKEPIIDYKFIDPLLKGLTDNYDTNLLLSFSYCTTARFFPDMCGHLGKKFEEVSDNK